jgi:outer membrane murein-binding lipoprotein Lpp
LTSFTSDGLEFDLQSYIEPISEAHAELVAKIEEYRADARAAIEEIKNQTHSIIADLIAQAQEHHSKEKTGRRLSKFEYDTSAKKEELLAKIKEVKTDAQAAIDEIKAKAEEKISSLLSHFEKPKETIDFKYTPKHNYTLGGKLAKKTTKGRRLQKYEVKFSSEELKAKIEEVTSKAQAAIDEIKAKAEEKISSLSSHFEKPEKTIDFKYTPKHNYTLGGYITKNKN